MLSITITDKSGVQRTMSFQQQELTIGRLENNDLVLPKTNVSKHHARVQAKDGRFVVADLQSTNGTYVNGRRISGPVALRKGDKVYIGDFILGLSDGESQQGPPSADATVGVAPLTDADLERMGLPGVGADDGPTRSFPVPHSEPPATMRPPAGEGATTIAPPPSSPSIPPHGGALNSVPPATGPINTIPAPPRTGFPSRPPRLEEPDSQRGPQTSPAVLTPSLRLQTALGTLMERLGEHMPIYEPRERAFPSEHAQRLTDLIEALASEGVISADLDRRFLQDAALSEAVGLGPLDRLLRNQAVREVVVDNATRILADLGGGLSPVSAFFSSRRAMEVVAERLLSRAATKVPAGNIREAMLPDGSHITVLSPPLTQEGVVFCVRCAQRVPVTGEGLVTEGLMSAAMLHTLQAAVRARVNILVSGARGAGSTRLISAIAGLAPDHERIVSIERRPGLSITHPQVITLARHASPGLTCQAAIEHAARLRFDRLALDEMHGEDCLPVLMTATTTGGIVVGLRAPSAERAISHLKMFAGMSVGSAGHAVDNLLTEALQLVVHMHSERDGLRRVDSISEVDVDEHGAAILRPLYVYNGSFRRTEHRPGFAED